MHYWNLISIFNIFLVIVFKIYFISVGFPIEFIIGLNWFIGIIIFLQYLIIKDIKSQILGIKRFDTSDDRLNVLGLFTKPQKITEEEVAVSKEKRMCLVCKGKLVRIMYICPDCSSFYCKKCSDALIDLENECWFCSAPFDESKPVRLTKSRKRQTLKLKRKILS